MVTEKQLQNLKKGVRFTPERAAMYGKQYHAKGVETRKKKRAVANMCALISQGKVNDDNLKEKLTACGRGSGRQHGGSLFALYRVADRRRRRHQNLQRVLRKGRYPPGDPGTGRRGSAGEGKGQLF